MKGSPAPGTHQLAVTVRATVAPGRLDELRAVLSRLDGEAVFGALPRVHFGRLVLLEDVDDIPASLLLMTEVDAPLGAHLAELSEIAATPLDAVLGCCAGYPATPGAAARETYLRERLVPAQAAYVNTIGRSVRQIRDEAALRDAIEAFLDERPPGDDVRGDVQGFVRGRADLAWAAKRARGAGPRHRAREAGHFLGWAAALTLAAPLLLAALPAYLVVLLLHERAEPAPHLRPDPEHVARLAAEEDHVAQNPFTAIGFIKAGRFRALTTRAVLWLIDFGARHVFTRASLSGVKTIHFARWVVLDGGRRVIFTSNYDGSLESYMDDFIDKVAYGLNASFSNGVGYPRTRALLFGGAKRELEFKDFLRRHQIPTQVWWSAYPDLSAANVDQNAYVRSGLFGELARPDAETWLRRL